MKKVGIFVIIGLALGFVRATEKEAVQIDSVKDAFSFLDKKEDTPTRISLEERANSGDIDAMCDLAKENTNIGLIHRVMASEIKEKNKFAYTAFYWASEAYKRGSVEASVRLGLLYENGIGVDEDVERALELYRQGAENGSAEALARLALYYKTIDVDKAKGFLGELIKIEAQENLDTEICLFVVQCYLEGVLCKKDIKKAVDILVKVQKLNEHKKSYDAILDEINNAVVFCYLRGIGVEKDENRALEIFSETINTRISTNANFRRYELGLCELENAEDYYSFARAYFNSEKFGYLTALYEGNKERARHFYQKSIDMGYHLGYYGLGKFAEENGDLEKAVEFYEKSCESLGKKQNFQEREAIYALANAYSKGIGTKKDIEKAAKLYELCAGNFVDARSALGLMYYENQDYDKAIKHLLKASAWDHSAEINLAIAVCYENGFGVKRDANKAIEFYKKAATKSEESQEIKENIKAIYCSIGVPFDEFYEEEPLDKKAMSGDADAMYELAKEYLHLEGLDGAAYKNIESAKTGFYWYKKAYENGSVEAIEKLGRCYEWGLGANANKAKALELYKEGWQKGSAYALLRLINTTKPLLTRGIADSKEMDSPEYLALLEMAREKDDLDPKIYETLANIALAKKDKEAIYFLEKILKSSDIAKERNMTVAYSSIALAYCYATGNLVEKDEAKAIELIEAIDESPFSIHILRSPYIFIKNLLGLYELKSAEDFYYIASIYDPSNISFKLDKNLIAKDEAKAISYYEKAANLGNRNAQDELIRKWKKGDEIEKKKAFDLCLVYLNSKDIQKANNFYKSFNAKYLADCYNEGKIVERDIEKAIKYYKIANKAMPNLSEPKRLLDELEKEIQKK